MKRHMMAFVVLLIAGVSQAFAEGEACPVKTEVSVTIEIIDDFVIPMSELTGQRGVQRIRSLHYLLRVSQLHRLVERTLRGHRRKMVRGAMLSLALGM